MKRTINLVAAALVLATTGVAHAGWAEKLFEERSYDFGTVPGGFDARHVFVGRNVFGEPVRLAGFIVACGCTEVRVGDIRVRPDYPNQQIMLDESRRIVLQPGETVEIEMALDTRKFVGEHKTTAVTVVFDRPSYSTVRLQMAAYIRQDVVTNPGAVVFGTVAQGETAKQTVEIEYAGGFDWRITTIRWNPELFDVTAGESYRRLRRVGYRLQVSLKPTAPAGIVRDTITVRTNDPTTPEINIPVEASILPALTITPSTLALGNVPRGTEVKKTLIVRGNEEFRIKEVRTSSPTVTVDFNRDRVAKIHMVSLRFRASDDGDHEVLVEVETDRQGGPLKAVLRAHVTP